MFLIPYYILTLIPFAAMIVYAGIRVSKLRNASTEDNAYLHFTYFSLTAWILGALQHVILLASLSRSSPSEFFRDTGLWLGFMQNAMWAGAVLSLHSKRLSPISSSLSLFKIFPIVIAFALLTYRTVVLTSEIFTLIDGIFTASIFIVLAVWTVQWGQSKKLASAFFIYGYTQFIWRALWFPTVSGLQVGILFAFPLWRLAILSAWIRLISKIPQDAQLPHQDVVRDGECLALPDARENIPAESTAESGRRRIPFIAKPMVITLLSVIVTVALGQLAVRNLPALVARWNVWWFTAIGTIVVILIGRGLFLFRRRNQILYGASEVGFAIPVIWINLAKLQKAPDATSLIALLTAAYLIVRGFINWEEGKTRELSN